MFNLFKKRQIPLVEHQHKNLSISLPSHWQYEIEHGDQEACFDPKSQSTFRIHIITAIPPKDLSDEKNLKVLIADLPYIITATGYYLTDPTYKQTIQSDNHITIITWRLINNIGSEKIMAILSYTVLSNEIESAKEKEAVTLIEKSIREAELL